MIEKRILDGEWQRPYWVQWLQNTGWIALACFVFAMFMTGLVEIF